jgi:sugar/nucleoside kinase (ribokinase family)
MTETRYDVIGVGNAIVDVIASCDDAFLAEHGIEKDAMTLIGEARASELYAAMGPGREISGGSGANTLAGVASLGARGAYVGKTAKDQLGDIFRHDLIAAGVDFDTAPLEGGPATARCLILVTPDAHRSMNTFLGASTEFTETDVDADKIAAAKITYLEGYLWDPQNAKEAFVKAAGIAHGAGRQVALTLSDSFCVDRYRDEFLDLMRKGVEHPKALVDVTGLSSEIRETDQGGLSIGAAARNTNRSKNHVVCARCHFVGLTSGIELTT